MGAIYCMLFFCTTLPKRASFEREMVIVIASYNNKDWYKRNLDSVFTQNYTNYTVKYVDDCSPDGTGQLVEDYIACHHLEHKIDLIKNNQRCGSLANIYHAIHASPDNAIIVQLDGDDWFAHTNVLARINKEYADNNVWLTYGSYERFPSGKGCCAPIPQKVVKANGFREYGWVSSALRTYYAWLFKQIKYDDFLYEGNFYQMAGDLAFMFPMLEMCGHRFKYISDILYVYNVASPINDSKKNERFQLYLDSCIRRGKKYKPLKFKNCK